MELPPLSNKNHNSSQDFKKQVYINELPFKTRDIISAERFLWSQQNVIIMIAFSFPNRCQQEAIIVSRCFQWLTNIHTAFSSHGANVFLWTKRLCEEVTRRQHCNQISIMSMPRPRIEINFNILILSFTILIIWWLSR